MERRHVDINELYDLFQERQDCYFVLCDIKHLTFINEISRKAGDLAILEQITDKIRSMNNQIFAFEQQEIPLSLHVTTTSLSECRRYEEVFTGLHNAIRDCKM